MELLNQDERDFLKIRQDCNIDLQQKFCGVSKKNNSIKTINTKY
jgi:hypothetical protein